MAEIRQQLQGGDNPAQRAGSPSLASAISPENPIYQGALADTADTAGDVSTRNDSATQRAETGNIRGICSPGVPAGNPRECRTSDPRISFDLGRDVLTICGINYAMSLFEHMAFSPTDGLFKIIHREDGVVGLKAYWLKDAEIDKRLLSALQDAGHSALGMPSSVDTIKAMLARAGLALVLA